ncbi:hypothetical protein [Brevibacillus borstelensis]
MIVHLSDYRSSKCEPMSKRTFEASMKDVTRRLSNGQISAEEGYKALNKLIDEYFFPEKHD